METQKNLIKGKDVIGLKVITLEHGQIIEDIDELVYDPQDTKVKALVVDEGGWFSDAKVILFEDIQTIGKDAVIISSAAVIKKASDVTERVHRIIKNDNYLTTNKVITEDGTDLGHVSDIYFDQQTGNVIEMEVSQGALKNVQSGKKRVKVADITRVGEDVTIVKQIVEDELEQQAQQQGVQGAVQTARNKTPDIFDQAKQKFTEFSQTTKEKAQQFTEQTQQKVQEIKEDPRTQNKIGAFKGKAKQMRDTVEQKTEQAKAGATDTLKEQQQKREINKKNDAVGKYLTVNILTVNDLTLARRGDMVTHTLLVQAEQAGVLDQVVNNVSSDPPPPQSASVTQIN